jgi:ribosomal protein S18 acetylase RimI-like enzyme
MNGYTISDDPAKIDLDQLHVALSRMYWCEGIPRAVMEKAVRNSLCFGVLENASGALVGFARVVTDHTTYAYLCDVYVLEAHRGRGLAKRLMEAVMAHPDLRNLRRFQLATRDAHGLYERFGFERRGDRHMEILRPNPYKNI